MANEATSPSAPPAPTTAPASSPPAQSSPKPATTAAPSSPPAPKSGPPSTPAGSAAGGTPAASASSAKPEDDGAVALRLVREQRERAKAEKRASELEAKLKAIETDANPFKTAAQLWKDKKYTQALKTGFGVKAFDDDLLVQLASEEPEPEHLTEEQLTERIRRQLEQERKAQEEQQAAQLTQLRAAAVQEVGSVLVASPEKWPTVWALGVTGEALGEFVDALPKKWGTPAEEVFEELEKSYRAKVQGLPWVPKPATPPTAPRSFGSETRRGPVDTAEDRPMTFAERQKAREQREAEFRATLKERLGGGQ